MLRNKKGEMDLGDAAAWGVALVVLFFFMVLFLSITLTISGKKAVQDKVGSFFGSEDNSISLASKGYFKGMNYNQEVLNQILDRYAIYEGNKIKIKDLLVLWANSENYANIKPILIDSIKEVADSRLHGQIDCYSFFAQTYKNQRDFILIFNWKVNEMSPSDFYGAIDSTSMNISSGEDIIKVNFGARECKL